MITSSNVVILGGTGEVGKGAAKAFLSHGIGKLIIITRNEENFNKVKKDYLNNDERVFGAIGDISTITGSQEIYDKVAAILKGEELHHFLSSSGPWWHVPSLQEAKPEIWQQAFDSNVNAHFYAYNRFAKITTRSYQIINGAAKNYLPKVGLTGILSNAVHGFGLVAVQEASQSKNEMRLYNVVLASSVGHQERKQTNDPFAYGHSFVAIAAGGHPLVKASSTFDLDDTVSRELISSL